MYDRYFLDLVDADSILCSLYFDFENEICESCDGIKWFKFQLFCYFMEIQAFYVGRVSSTENYI